MLSEARHSASDGNRTGRKKVLATVGSLFLSNPRLLSSLVNMTSNISCDSTTPVRSTDENQKVDRWAGALGEGGYLWENIDTLKAVWPLATWCFLTGYMSVFILHLGTKNLFQFKIPGISSHSLPSSSGVLSRPETPLRCAQSPSWSRILPFL